MVAQILAAGTWLQLKKMVDAIQQITEMLNQILCGITQTKGIQNINILYIVIYYIII